MPRRQQRVNTTALGSYRLPADASTSNSPIVLIDGLTKCFRLPGWRCCWVVGPKQLIKALGQSGSYLDGGASHPTQIAAIPLLEPKRVQQDKEALQKCFLEKRNHVLKRLEEMGLKVEVPPEGRPKTTKKRRKLIFMDF